jgi:threonine dehydrogenase-like Zn-dependent dehydrogenase
VRAFVITGAGQCAVHDVEPPAAGPGQVIVDVARAGVCGTDAEFFSGDMSYLHSGQASYPVRIGHEWCGTVGAVGAGVDPGWLGRRVTGDTMLGCGKCARCRGGRQHVCADRFEIGVRRGWPGALAEQLPVPVTALHPLPDTVDDTLGALVEPGGNALRSVQAASLAPGERLLVLGPGTIGLLAAQFARGLGFTSVWPAGDLPPLDFDAVIDASPAAGMPAFAIEAVQPGRRVVFIGIAGAPSTIDTRALVLKDVTAVGILSASPGMAQTIERYAAGAVDPRPLVAATVGLGEVGSVLAGASPAGARGGPKIHVDPRL